MAAWTLIDGVALARELEPVVGKAGYHVAIGGSTLHAGESDKDVDLIVYPRKTNECGGLADVISTIESAGFVDFEERPHEYVGDAKVVFKAERDGKRVDFFFLS